MSEATQAGAEAKEPSIHEQIMAKLDPAPAEVVDEEEKPAAEVEDPAVEDAPDAEATSDEALEAGDEVQTEEQIESDEPQIELTDLAQYLGLDADKLDVNDEGELIVKTKIDGEDGAAKFKDLIKSHQLEGHLNKQNMETVEKQKQLDAKAAELEAHVQTKVQEAESIIQLAWQELTKESEGTDWADLRANDPAEFAAKQTEIKTRQETLATAYQQIQTERQTQIVANQAKLEENIQAENAKLIGAVEGWDNPEKAQKEYGDVMSYLQTTYNFSSEDLYGNKDQSGRIINPGITDHRAVVMARKAMLYDQLQQTKPSVTKKVRIAPKITKGGTPKVIDVKEQTKKAALDKVKRLNGKQGSVAEALLATGKVK